MRASVTPCDQTREYVSLALDGELVEVERMRLDAHLAACAECRAFQADIGAVSRELRASEPEQPAESVVLPRASRRVSLRSIQVGAAAAAVVAIVAAGSVFQSIGRQTGSEPLQLSQNALFSAGDDVAPNLHPTKHRPLKHHVAV